MLRYWLIILALGVLMGNNPLQELWDFIMPSAYADVSQPVYGKKKFREELPKSELATIDKYRPAFENAIKKAENNPRNFGVLSVDTNDPGRVLNNSIINNFYRWIMAGKPGKFVDFMQRRWAPIGAENDPKNLNRNWAPNVRKFLKRDPQEYEQMRRLNLVMNFPDYYGGGEV